MTEDPYAIALALAGTCSCGGRFSASSTSHAGRPVLREAQDRPTAEHPQRRG
jgi:hypothetical protein